MVLLTGPTFLVFIVGRSVDIGPLSFAGGSCDMSSFDKFVTSYTVGFVFQILCFVKDDEHWGYAQELFEKVARMFRGQVWLSYLLLERTIVMFH